MAKSTQAHTPADRFYHIFFWTLCGNHNYKNTNTNNNINTDTHTDTDTDINTTSTAYVNFCGVAPLYQHVRQRSSCAATSLIRTRSVRIIISDCQNRRTNTYLHILIRTRIVATGARKCRLGRRK